jgi:hypothetical protein
LPEAIRGRSFAVVLAAHLGGEADGADLLRPLRELGAEMDTFAMVPPAALSYLAMDPDAPMPYASDSQIVGELPAAAIDDPIAVAGPGSGSELAAVELRHLAARSPGARRTTGRARRSTAST